MTNEPLPSRPTLFFRARSLLPSSFRDAIIISTVAIIISLGLFGLFVLCSSVNPLDVYALMYRGAFGTAYSWRNSLIHAAPIMLTALCVVLPARVGLIIIGGEGCVLLGGLVAAWTAHLLPHSPPAVVIPAMILMGMTAGGIWIAMVAAMKIYRGVNETISSLLLNYVALAILNHCVEGPLHDPTSLNHPSSWPIGEANMLGNIPGTEIHLGLLFGLIACVAAWFVMSHTPHGMSSNIIGGNLRAARLVGLPVKKIMLINCFLGGAAAALTGVVEVAAVHGHANDSLACGYGYAGILVAFVARQNPLAVIPVAILLGGASASGDLLQAEVGLSSATVQVFQGILFLVILALDTWAGRMHELPQARFARPFVWLTNALGRRFLPQAGAP